MQRLSRSIAKIKDQYQVVVVGSGYGGGVAASRMARAGRNVCVLERGREFLPGEFPDTLKKAAEEIQINLKGKPLGNKSGLYDYRVDEDMSVFLGCGLGGTSLVNANVSLQAEPKVFGDPVWPTEIRNDATQPDSALALGYQRAERMLNPVTYPENFPKLAKTDAHKCSAQSLGEPFKLTPINVSFVEHSNHVGVNQSACTLCGDCVSGCNIGAKNTTAMNYLPDAVNHGAEIFCQAKVSHIEKAGELWRVYYHAEELGRDAFDAAPLFVFAEKVVLAAGALGSTEILLRSQQRGLPLSPALGKRFTGNGDTLAFAYNCDREIDGIGHGDEDSSRMPPVGPCITSVIDARRKDDLNESLVIEEGSIPGALAPLLPAAFSLANSSGVDTDEGFADALSEKARMVESTVRGARHGATQNTQIYLVMAHDDSDGELKLDGDSVRVRWSGVGRKPVFKHIEDKLIAATRPLGGTYIRNPIWNKLFNYDLVTVHPLGGCAMADDADSGVVNHMCQVFDGNGGVYNNLMVCDGAAMPRSLGVNPLLTISAVAERACHLVIAENGWKENYTATSARKRSVAEPGLGIQFTETMRGHLLLDGSITDYDEAAKRARSQNSPFEFTLSVISDDLDTLLDDESHAADLFGSVLCPALSDKPLVASQGVFNLLTRDSNSARMRRMEYRMHLATEEGRRYYLHGYKRVLDDHRFDLWPDTTTLYISLYDGDDSSAPILGRGVLIIEPKDLARQATTMRARNANGMQEAASAVARFGRYFAGALAETYGGPLAPFRVYDPAKPRRRRNLRCQLDDTYLLPLDNGDKIQLSRYKGGDKGPVILAHGLGVSSRIFSLDTVDTNLLEYLHEKQYDVWLLDYRASIELSAAENRFNADDIADEDYPLAVAKVCEVTGRQDVQMVAHCFGASTFSMSMARGHCPQVRSAVLSQISLHYRAPFLSRFKAGLYLPSLLDALGVDSLTAYRDRHANWTERLYDNALRFYPQELEEQTNSPVDKRITFMYGQLWEVDQLNTATHDTLHELFGVANIESFEHLARMVREGHAVGFNGDDRYLSGLSKMAIPIRFIHGAENQAFLPESTERTVAALTSANGASLYDRHVIPDYGHIDCIFGHNAVRDVYPLISQHLDSH